MLTETLAADYTLYEAKLRYDADDDDYYVDEWVNANASHVTLALIRSYIEQLNIAESTNQIFDEHGTRLAAIVGIPDPTGWVLADWYPQLDHLYFSFSNPSYDEPRDFKLVY